ncbi:TetR/AcrR family transcriptional regulator [Fodinicola feengrottensis]|uniref:TetR/AcrR family transcriptional regulator n=1 Tax=Fodinicola feengrottensis TaxID=435914 RepID=UPI0024429215|nr:helix-turn-helix domain containing protein [Fodinicola feengrottensis]
MGAQRAWPAGGGRPHAVLYSERGFEQTTAADIARQAGLTERTYFRHFKDKREVLFWGAAQLEELFVTAVTGAPDSATPIEAIAVGLDAAAHLFEDRREASRQRQAVIVANAELRERELIKLANLAARRSPARCATAASRTPPRASRRRSRSPSSKSVSSVGSTTTGSANSASSPGSRLPSSRP